MTKKTLQLLATVALVTGMGLVSATTAHAADNTANVTTTGNVTLTADDGEEGGGGNAGGIVLKKTPWITVPSSKINGSDQTIAATVDSALSSGDGNGAVQVVNAGHKSSWKVQLANTVFTDPDSKDVMNASTLDFGAATLKAVDDTANATTAPSLVNQGLSLNTGSATQNQDVVGATYTTDSKEGVGTFNTTYSGAKLNLKAGNVAGNYQSTLTWTLTNTPATS